MTKGIELEEPVGTAMARTMQLQTTLEVLVNDYMKQAALAHIDPLLPRNVALPEREIQRAKRILTWSRRIVRTHLAAPYKQYHSAQRTAIYAVFSGWLSSLIGNGALFTSKDVSVLAMQMQVTAGESTRMLRTLVASELVAKIPTKQDGRHAFLVPTKTTVASLCRQMLYGELVQDLESYNLELIADDTLRHDFSPEYFAMFTKAREVYEEIYANVAWHQRKPIG